MIISIKSVIIIGSQYSSMKSGILYIFLQNKEQNFGVDAIIESLCTLIFTLVLILMYEFISAFPNLG